MVIVAAVDQTDLASAVIEEGRRLADAFDDDLHVIHVLSQSDFVDYEQDNVRHTGQPGGKSAGEEHAKGIATELAEFADAEEFTPIGFVGKPSERIVDYAEDVEARYLVIGGRKRSPVGKAIFGSTTQSVLMNAQQSIVTVMQE